MYLNVMPPQYLCSHLLTRFLNKSGILKKVFYIYIGKEIKFTRYTHFNLARFTMLARAGIDFCFFHKIEFVIY